jgi:hypothetical protein
MSFTMLAPSNLATQSPRPINDAERVRAELLVIVAAESSTAEAKDAVLAEHLAQSRTEVRNFLAQYRPTR